MRKSAEFWLRITIVVFFVAILIGAPTVLFPFGISMIIAILLSPLAQHIQKLICRAGVKKWPYDFSIILSFAVFIGILCFIAVHIFVPFVNELQEFTKSLPSTFLALQNTILELQAKYDLNVLPPEMQKFIISLIQDVGEYTIKIAQFSVSALFSFAGTVIELIVVPFVTFYMMKRGKYFTQLFISFFPEQYHNHLQKLFTEIHFVLRAYVHGQLLLCVLMAFVVFVGMWIMDIPYPLVIGLLAGVVEMVPIIGPVVGAIPPILLGVLQGYGVMMQVILFYIIVQQIDSHFVMPKLMGSIIDVHPLAIIGGVLIGGSLFGIVGMMISVPIVAVLQILLKHMWYYDKYKNMNGGNL